MMYGLLGKHLSHSYSPALHASFGDYPYVLFEREEAELPAFFETPFLSGFNVTIPYKKAVLPYLSGLSETARRLGSVNTVLRTENGFYGDNTDYAGFLALVRRSGYDPMGKKAVVLGNGGVCPAVCAVLSDLGAREITVISRSGENNYETVSRHADASLLVNTTPVGMHPDNGSMALSPKVFSKLDAVLDLIYNPFETALCAAARRNGILAMGGMYMLCAQARAAAELFTGSRIPGEKTEEAFRKLVTEKKNLVLIGMPGSGKTTLGKAAAARLSRTFYDCDLEIEQKTGMSVPLLFAKQGEEAFRRLETETVRALGKRSGLVISTGGGVVTREENEALLKQNSVIICLSRPLSRLSCEGRPLSQSAGTETLFRERAPLYARFADKTVACGEDIGENTEKIVEAFYEAACDQRT